MRRRYAIYDIDGTISSSKWRESLYLKKELDEFYSAIPFDRPILEVLKMLIEAEDLGFDIIYMTGRPEKYRKHTLSWFEKYKLPEGQLIMRPNGIRSKNSEIKSFLFEEYLKMPKHEIKYAVEDNEHVVEMWFKKGISVVKVEDPGLEPKIFGS